MSGSIEGAYPPPPPNIRDLKISRGIGGGCQRRGGIWGDDCIIT